MQQDDKVVFTCYVKTGIHLILLAAHPWSSNRNVHSPLHCGHSKTEEKHYWIVSGKCDTAEIMWSQSVELRKLKVDMGKKKHSSLMEKLYFS